MSGFFDRKQPGSAGMAMFHNAGDPPFGQIEDLVLFLGRAGVDCLKLAVPLPDSAMAKHRDTNGQASRYRSTELKQEKLPAGFPRTRTFREPAFRKQTMTGWTVIEWSEEQNALRSGFARWHGALGAEHIELDRLGGFPMEKWQLACRSGILRLPFDDGYGGLGQSLLTTMYVLEELGYGCRDGGLNFSISTHVAGAGVPIQRFGKETLKQRYLAAICNGTMIGAHAVTEPSGGSDALGIKTTAVADGDFYVLEGSKTFVTNGPVADLFIVYARTDPEPGPWGVSAFVVERNTPGFSVGPPMEKMGLRTSPLCELFFDNCRIPAGNMIGKPGLGFSILDYVTKWEILCSFIINVGEMQHRFERCVEYARTRQQFNRPIGSFQSIANKIVDMKIRVETARSWLYLTAARFQSGGNITTDIAIAKLLASESNVASALDAIQIFGGNGYMTEYGLEKELRNAVAGTIYSGTSEVQRDRIAKMLGL